MRILLTIVLFSVSVFAQNGLENVSWLTGCWGGDMKSGRYEECWTAPSGNFMQGAASLVKKDKVSMREAMTIEKEGNDIVMYVLGYGDKLKPDDQGTIGFKLTRSSKTELVFENPAHDYPQRIVYSKNKKGGIIARIEMLDGTNPISFPMNNMLTKK